jgi:hypothetical protein
MKEIIVTKNQLIEMFKNEELRDGNNGWVLHGIKIEIIAIHELNPKYVQNITDAKYYKLVSKINNQI